VTARLLSLLVVAGAVLTGTLMVRVPVNAQAPATTRDAPLLTMKVQGSVHMIAGAGANIAVQVGDLGPIVVDTGAAPRAEATLASIRSLTPRPIRFVIDCHCDPMPVGLPAPQLAAMHQLWIDNYDWLLDEAGARGAKVSMLSGGQWMEITAGGGPTGPGAKLLRRVYAAVAGILQLAV
jgi:hypothetical protein